jgi:hypothetical protein
MRSMAAVADEQRIRRCPGPFDEPVPKHLDAILPDGGGPFLAALAHASDVSAGAELDVAAVERDKLGDTQARLKRQHEDGTVASAGPRRDVRSCDDSLDLVASHVVDDPYLVALRRHGEHALAVMQKLRLIDRDVLEEGPDGRETRVSAPSYVAARFLDIS